MSSAYVRQAFKGMTRAYNFPEFKKYSPTEDKSKLWHFTIPASAMFSLRSSVKLKYSFYASLVVKQSSPVDKTSAASSQPPTYHSIEFKQDMYSVREERDQSGEKIT